GSSGHRTTNQQPEENPIIDKVGAFAREPVQQRDRARRRERQQPMQERHDDERGVGGRKDRRRKHEQQAYPDQYGQPGAELRRTRLMIQSRAGAVGGYRRSPVLAACTHRGYCRETRERRQGTVPRLWRRHILPEMDQSIHIAATQAAAPCTIVIFGASGDLAKRKLLPAIYNLSACGERVAPENFAVVGFARRPMTVEKFRSDARDWAARYSRLELDQKCWNDFATRLDYVSGLDQADGFHRLRQRLEQLEAERHLPPNRIYYLSVPPEAVAECIERLGS